MYLERFRLDGRVGLAAFSTGLPAMGLDGFA